MKSLIKFFKGLGGEELPKVVQEKKKLTPEEKEDQELLRLGATDLDMNLVSKLRQLKEDGKVEVMCDHSGKPLFIAIGWGLTTTLR